MGAPRLTEDVQKTLTEFFRACALFADVDPAAAAWAAQNSELLKFQKSQPIILENEANDSVHFVVQGSVEILSYLTSEKRIQRLALLKEGSHFGEFSILTQTARSGSAYAYVDCTIARMSGTAFLQMLESYPGVGIQLLGRLARLSHESLNKTEFVPFYVDGSRHLTEQALQLLPQSMWKKFNVIPLSLKSGVLSVAIRDPHNQAFYSFIKTSFPKIEVSVSLIGERDFSALVEQSAVLPSAGAARESLPPLDVLGSLAKSRLFSIYSPEKIAELLPRLEHVTVKSGDPILLPKQAVDACYVILRGSVYVNRTIRGSTAVARAMILKSGASFANEQALLEELNPCSCRAIDDTDLIAIPKDVINELLDDAAFVTAFTREVAGHLQLLGHVSGVYYTAPDAQYDFAGVATVFTVALIDEEKIVPLKLDDSELTIGFVNPESTSTLTRIDRYIADYRVRVAGITEDQFKIYRLAVKTLVEKKGVQTLTAGNEKVDVVRWVNSSLIEGFESGASDIHFEPSLTGMMVRYRVDGVLRESTRRLPVELVPQVTSRLKILASMDISVSHKPQDGHLETEAEKVKMQARVSTLPVLRGEKVVLRLIREKNSVPPLDMITPDRRIVNTMKAVGELRQGLFLVTGPTGSGKTSTLYSLLKTINQVDANVISIEDPVEMELRGVNQVSINTKRGVEFADVLRSVLRQDPDVVMVGEIRDPESARVVFDAAMTGCLVLSTVHSGSALDTIHRLKDLGITPSQISEGLVGVITQRLLRKVCQNCGTNHEISDSERDLYALVPSMEAPSAIRRGAGCVSCAQTGYMGRFPVFEAWMKNRDISDGIRAGLPISELEVIARSHGFESLFEFALRQVKSGLTTPEEIRRVLSGTGTLF
jgi:type IV pilus assembly protein PilB